MLSRSISAGSMAPRRRGNLAHDVTDCGRRGLRSASGRSSSDQPVAVSERLLARPGDDARDDRPGVAVLSRRIRRSRRGRTGGRRKGKPGSSLADMQTQALDPFGVSYGICNPLYGVQMVFSEDMADAFCRALNDWLVEGMARQGCATARLDRDSRAEHREVGRRDRALRQGQRFVQVLMLVMGDMPLGKRAYWPIYAAAERLGLPVGIHAGSELSQPADLGRLGLLSHRGLCRAGAGVPDPVDQPDRRGRVRAASET